MDEHMHKDILDRPRAPRRWIKTNPAGWFGYNPQQHPQSLVVVEGAFDRLALLAAGMMPAEVIALAGTAIRPDWFPGHVSTVILALDADAGGEHASLRLVERLEQAGIRVFVCPPPQDWRGKDWSERWRTSGWAGIYPIFEAHIDLVHMLPAAKRGA
jgi:DNA primase